MMCLPVHTEFGTEVMWKAEMVGCACMHGFMCLQRRGVSRVLDAEPIHFLHE